MFKSLKDKLSGWFKKKPEEEQPGEPKKVEEKKVVKESDTKSVEKTGNKEAVVEDKNKATEVKEKTVKKEEVAVSNDVKERKKPDVEGAKKTEIKGRASEKEEKKVEEKEVKSETKEDIAEKVPARPPGAVREKELSKKEVEAGEPEEKKKVEEKEVTVEKKSGFFGKIKKAFSGKDLEDEAEEVEELKKEVDEKSEELEDELFEESDKKVSKKKAKKFEKVKKAALESEKEFEKEEVDIRGEELLEDVKEKEVEAGKDEEEPLAEKEVHEEVESGGGFFGKLAKRLTTSELAEKEFDEFFDEFEFTLLEHNVALGVVDKIRESLNKSLVGKKFSSKEVEGKILGALKGAIEGVLIEPEDLIGKIKAKGGKDPFVILFFGINGSGKTTSVAKLAHKLKKEGFGVVMAAGDTFRAASIEQLETHGERLGIEVVKSDYGKDPASVAFDAISHAKKKKAKVVLIDTAGRMYTRSNLMREMEKIVKVSKPDLKIFVGESITGNDATEQAKMFAETAGIDGIILSKADVDEKAGTILSVSWVTGKPIFYLGVGQNYEDLQVFSKNSVLKNLGLD
jgi:fused signal recognition particle receptor